MPNDGKTNGITYYPINEAGAKRAKEMNSFFDYTPGSATEEYRRCVDKAAALAERQKARVDPMYHEKIDRLLDAYARKLAENMYDSFAIDTRVPSMVITGGSNFPVRKKEKQNAAHDRNMDEWRQVQGLLDKIRSTGMGGISADDPRAVAKLESKLASLESTQEKMKAVNAYYRKHKSASLTRQKEVGYTGWDFDGGRVEANTADNRLQIFFDDKPDEETRTALKSNGFRWAPSVSAWQRQLNDNAIYAAGKLDCIRPLTGESPSEVQNRVRLERETDAIAAEAVSGSDETEQDSGMQMY